MQARDDAIADVVKSTWEFENWDEGNFYKQIAYSFTFDHCSTCSSAANGMPLPLETNNALRHPEGPDCALQVGEGTQI